MNIVLKLHDCYYPKIIVYPREYYDKNDKIYYKAVYNSNPPIGFIVRQGFYSFWLNKGIWEMTIKREVEDGVDRINLHSYKTYMDAKESNTYFIGVDGIYVEGEYTQINSDGEKETNIVVPTYPNRNSFLHLKSSYKVKRYWLDEIDQLLDIEELYKSSIGTNNNSDLLMELYSKKNDKYYIKMKEFEVFELYYIVFRKGVSFGDYDPEIFEDTQLHDQLCNPSNESAGKGKKYLSLVYGSIAELLYELKNTEKLENSDLEEINAGLENLKDEMKMKLSEMRELKNYIKSQLPMYFKIEYERKLDWGFRPSDQFWSAACDLKGEKFDSNRIFNGLRIQNYVDGLHDVYDSKEPYHSRYSYFHRSIDVSIIFQV